jgi:hypothetical protein
VKVTGGGSVVELGVADERHHEPERHEMWQDSVVLAWWDLGNGIGGYHRIGHHPFHPDGPQAQLTTNFFTADAVYKRCGWVPLREQDVTETGFGCGDDACRFDFTDHAVWTFDDEVVQGELHVSDFHPPVDIYPKTGQLAERITAGHLEVGGAVTGRLRFRGTDHQVDGLAFRDHGWGKRFWEDFVSHRWVAGTFGPDLTVLAVSVLGTDDSLAQFGCVIRDGELTYADTTDIVTYLESDGLTHRGGRLRLELPGEPVLDIGLAPLQKGAVSWMVDLMAVTDTMSTMTLDGRVGICNFEISNNAARGRHRPRFAVNGVTEDGLHLLGGP